MNRFFVEKTDIEGDTAYIRGDDVKHIAKVLRLSAGDTVLLCDGDETEYISNISRIEKECVELAVMQRKHCEAEPSHRIALVQGLPKAGKLETIIQKCVELGVYEVMPVQSARSVVKIEKKDAQARNERWQRVSYEAAKQSGRGVIPIVRPLTTLDQADLSRFDEVVVLYEDERDTTLKSVLHTFDKSVNTIAIVIGPEGGLERCEVDKLINNGAHCATLGRRILRTETAGMAALAMILYELEG